MLPVLLFLCLAYPLFGGYTPVDVTKVHYDVLDRAYPYVQKLVSVKGSHRSVEKTIEKVAHKTSNGNNFLFKLKGGVCFETYEAFDGSDFAIVGVTPC